jgi:hypothetical protein
MATKKTSTALQDWSTLVGEASTLRSKIPTSYYTGYTPIGGTSKESYEKSVTAFNKKIGQAEEAFKTQLAPETLSWDPYSRRVTDETNQYLSRINQIKIGDYDFSTSPVSFNPITALQIDSIAEADKVLKYTQSRVGDYGKLAKEMTAMDMQNREAQLDEFVPGWRDSTNKVKAINDQYLRGEIPRDVANQLTRSAAYITAMGGGSAQNQAALTARDLGRTSLQMQQLGIAGTQNYMNMMTSLMPATTSIADVIGTQGLTTGMALDTAKANQQTKLMADYYTSTGQLRAAEATQELRLRGQEAASQRSLGLAGIEAGAYGKALEAQIANIVAGYEVEETRTEKEKAYKDQLANLSIAQNPNLFKRR